MSPKTRPRGHLQVLPDVPVDPGPCCDAERRRDSALLHFEIGLRTHGAGLPTDWSHVAYRMAMALVGGNDWREDAEAPS